MNHISPLLRDIALAEFELLSVCGAFIVISHDRYFLDRTVSKIIDIENGKSSVYNGNYSFFIKQKDAARAAFLPLLQIIFFDFPQGMCYSNNTMS